MAQWLLVAAIVILLCMGSLWTLPVLVIALAWGIRSPRAWMRFWRTNERLMGER